MKLERELKRTTPNESRRPLFAILSDPCDSSNICNRLRARSAGFPGSIRSEPPVRVNGLDDTCPSSMMNFSRVRPWFAEWWPDRSESMLMAMAVGFVLASRLPGGAPETA